MRRQAGQLSLKREHKARLTWSKRVYSLKTINLSYLLLKHLRIIIFKNKSIIFPSFLVFLLPHDIHFAHNLL